MMLDELQSTRLTVSFVADERSANGLRRAAETDNADWYRKFCAKYPSNRVDADTWREFKTAIKRYDTVKALKKLIAGTTKTTNVRYGVIPYTERLLPFVAAYAAEKEAEELEIRRDIRRQWAVPF